jgi:ribosomal protein S27AE
MTFGIFVSLSMMLFFFPGQIKMIKRKLCPRCGSIIREFNNRQKDAKMKSCSNCGQWVSEETWETLKDA